MLVSAGAGHGTLTRYWSRRGVAAAEILGIFHHRDKRNFACYTSQQPLRAIHALLQLHGISIESRHDVKFQEEGVAASC